MSISHLFNDWYRKTERPVQGCRHHSDRGRGTDPWNFLAGFSFTDVFGAIQQSLCNTLLNIPQQSLVWELQRTEELIWLLLALIWLLTYRCLCMWVPPRIPTPQTISLKKPCFCVIFFFKLWAFNNCVIILSLSKSSRCSVVAFYRDLLILMCPFLNCW